MQVIRDASDHALASSLDITMAGLLRARRLSLIDFARWADPRWRPAKHLEILAAELERCLHEPNSRLMIWMPPRHGKSELTSRLFPVYALAHNPRLRVMLASYSDDFALLWGRRSRLVAAEVLPRLGLSVGGISRGAEWSVSEGGSMKSTGVGGSLTGRGFDLGIIDDPVKNAEEAYSHLRRDKAWDWWLSTFATRREPGAAMVVIQTRWHEDDLSGRLLNSPGAERWRVISLPALAEENDALGRAPGEALWPQRWPREALEQVREEQGSWVWRSLYQQSPRPQDGAIWKRSWFRYYSVSDGNVLFDHGSYVDGNGRHFVTVDLAMSSKETADFSVFQVWDQKGDRLFLRHQERAQIEAPAILDVLERLWRKYHVDTAYIEAVQGQLYICQLARQRGLVVEEVKPDRDKRSRYMAASVWWERGQVYFPREAPWLPALEAELLGAPVGRNDDQCDAATMATMVLDCTRPPIPFTPPPLRGSTQGGFQLARPK